jgi:hypothetical protein
MPRASRFTPGNNTRQKDEKIITNTPMSLLLKQLLQLLFLFRAEISSLPPDKLWVLFSLMTQESKNDADNSTAYEIRKSNALNFSYVPLYVLIILTFLTAKPNLSPSVSYIYKVVQI